MVKLALVMEGVSSVMATVVMVWAAPARVSWEALGKVGGSVAATVMEKVVWYFLGAAVVAESRAFPLERLGDKLVKAVETLAMVKAEVAAATETETAARVQVVARLATAMVEGALVSVVVEPAEVVVELRMVVVETVGVAVEMAVAAAVVMEEAWVVAMAEAKIIVVVMTARWRPPAL